ncbi:hypothetical protein KCP75_26175 [Salmonella enterica subsp. enterica]|nr:hypothetical protein KCP75_26175 [Salmonella enterica subsp. enterica]
MILTPTAAGQKHGMADCGAVATTAAAGWTAEHGERQHISYQRYALGKPDGHHAARTGST